MASGERIRDVTAFFAYAKEDIRLATAFKETLVNDQRQDGIHVNLLPWEVEASLGISVLDQVRSTPITSDVGIFLFDAS